VVVATGIIGQLDDCLVGHGARLKEPTLI